MKGYSIKLALLFVISIVLAACSEGGGHNPALDPPREESNPTGKAGSILFDSVSSEVLSIKGTGETGSTHVSMNRPEASTVVFYVKDTEGNPLPNQVVNFSLTNTEGGLTLTKSQDTSDSEGRVQTTVNSGVVPASIRVRASFTPVGESEIFTFSNILVISTGLPDQNSFSIAPEVLNPEAWTHDGEEVRLVVLVGDRFNNPVPDGTPVMLQTEGGMAEASCLTKNGLCVVKPECNDTQSDPCLSWFSGPPRPADGRVTILATAVGEESFVDANNNGRFDDGELAAADDLPEAFLDNDEDGSFDSGTEFFRDFDGNLQYDTASGFYNGSLCTQGAIALGHCASLINVRASTVMVMSSSTVNITFSAASVDVSGGSANIAVRIADVNGNAPPAGSQVNIQTSAGKLDGKADFLVPSRLDPHVVGVGIVSTDPASVQNGILTVTVTSPSGVVSSAGIPVTDGP